ncbi:PP2C family protein-serine/threonine phosphatase [Flammeovirga aprica]|uniref:SpoIIE family protein phosphatase n=1 Tax=Flammeovirga aprica JL-4 TaxID=694437 RepID=A0A7X9P2P2_9BACT|nr:SpoIIE family protein phosphatase [Flammeovirga aprica]NME68453.1 SpoIIE family protein phosphatase [Flammeovirga aprica JL-4]
MKFDLYNFFRIKSRVFLAIMIAFIAVFVFLDLKTEVVILAMLSLIQVGIVLFASKSQQWTWILHVQILLLTTIVTVISFMGGGIISPVIFFYIPTMCVSFLFFDIRTGAIYTFSILCLAIVLALTSIYHLSPFPPLELAPVHNNIYLTLVLIGSSTDTLWTILQYEGARNKVEQELKGNHDEIIQQEEELRQQQEELISTREHELELAQTKTTALEEEQRRIKAEQDLFVIQEALKYTSEIQQITLPDNDVLKDYFNEHTLIYKPKESISGDFFYVNDYNKTTLVVVGDCKGHAISATLLTMVISGYFDSLQELPYYPSLLLYNLHDYLISQFNNTIEDKEQFRHEINLSIAYFQGSHLLYTSANGRCILVQEGEIKELPYTDAPIGDRFNLIKNFKDVEYPISPDDVVLMFTDGLTKIGATEDTSELLEICQDFYGKYEKDWTAKIQKYIDKNFATEQQDDITALAFNLN